MRLDKENGNTHWQDAMDLELTQIHEYKVFKDTGKAQFHNGKLVIPDGFQKIRVHFVYAVKHDGRFKARLVADGHLTKEPVGSPQVSFLMCTLEIPQKLQYKFFCS